MSWVVGFSLRDTMTDYRLPLDGLLSSANTLQVILNYIMLLDHYMRKNTRHTTPNDT
jgi:hypothetical protein